MYDAIQTSTVSIADLAPTQMTVGMREVDLKRRRWRQKSSDEATDYLKTCHFPAVLGPDSRHFLLDHHHLALALNCEGIRAVPVSIVADLRALSLATFWTTLEGHNWTRPFDDEGLRCSYDDMPASVHGLLDDPLRSLSGELKRVGGYVKDKELFVEFRWADFLRCRIPRELVEGDFDRALALAVNLAQSTEAAALPGWRRDPPQSALHRTNAASWRDRACRLSQRSCLPKPVSPICTPLRVEFFPARTDAAMRAEACSNQAAALMIDPEVERAFKSYGL